MDEPGVLDIIRLKRERLELLQAEVAKIQAELRDIGLAAAGKPLPLMKPAARGRPKGRHGFTNGKRAKPIQPGSSVGRTLGILRAEGVPLQADKIIDLLNRQTALPRVSKATLVSNLSRYVAHKDTFTRPAPNTFGLIELEGGNELENESGQRV